MKLVSVFQLYLERELDSLQRISNITVVQTGKFRRGHHFTVMQPVKPGKDNTDGILRYLG